MSFNPISMDDDAITGDVMSFTGTRRGNGATDAYSAVEENRRSGMMTHASVGGVTVVDSSMTAGEFIRRCKQQYYFEFSWQVPFPQLPAAPLLYVPDAVQELLRGSSPLGVMQAELEAMAAGVLSRIPLAYHLLQPGVIEESRGLAQDCARRVEVLREQTEKAGLQEPLAWRPEEVNPRLEAADAALLDTDIDLNLVLERDKPSLTLLQRPLYTDMGLVPQEQRHLERLARIVPETLRSQAELTATQEVTQFSPGSWDMTGEGIGTSTYPKERSITGGGVNISNTHSNSEASKQWLDGVRKSFRYARTLDSHYEKMLQSIARTKLGLDDKDPASVRLTRRLWQLLFDEKMKNQQRDIWHQFCRFSSNYDGRGEAAEKLKQALMTLQVPHQTQWSEILKEYTNLLQSYTLNLPGGAEKRKEQLQISGKELDPFEQGAFEPDLQPGPTLRRVSKELGANRQSLPIFPVEVAPLFPADFDKAETLNEDENERRLGEMSTRLHHVILPGAVVGDEARVGGPHALINNTNLLVAEKKSSRQLTDGVTVSYNTSRKNTFEMLVEDVNNTSSYIFQICNRNSQCEKEEQSLPNPTGIANADGRHVVYRRLGIRNLFVKAANADPPPYERYVLMFDGESEMTSAGGRKRYREGNSNSAGAMEDHPAVLQRVE